MVAMTSSLTRPLRLARGDVHSLQLPRGAQLVNLGGAVLMEQAPQWFEGQAQHRVQRLDSGDAERLQEGGWVTLTALSDAQLMCVAPAPSRWPARLMSWLPPALRLSTES